jgi:ABC-type molybdate transport system ATPase subunit
VEPDVLVVDEALAVGDAAFSNRCIQKFEELKCKGVTVLFVSHDLGLVKRLSDRAIFMLEGRVAAEGSPSDVVNRYVGHVLEREKNGAPAQPEAFRTSFRHGDGASRIIAAELATPDGAPAAVVPSGAPVVVKVRARVLKPANSPVVGILIRNRLGIDVFGTNTRVQPADFGSFKPGEEIEVSFRFDCLLTQQEYTLTVATQHWDGSSQDWLDDVLSFRVVDSGGVAGLVNLGTEIEWQRR